MTSRILVALDYGRKRIGLALSTPLGTVHPRPRLERRTLQADLDALAALAGEEAAEAFVVGLPRHMHGGESEMEREARAFAARLAERTGLPVYGVDERLTTEAAEAALAEQGLSGRRRKERKDSAAACLLLQDFLSLGEAGERLA